MGAIMAKERMDYYAVVSMLDVIMKLITIIILPYLPFDKLIIYSLITLIISIFDFVCYYIYAKQKILIKKMVGILTNNSLIQCFLFQAGT